MGFNQGYTYTNTLQCHASKRNQFSGMGYHYQSMGHETVSNSTEKYEATLGQAYTFKGVVDPLSGHKITLPHHRMYIMDP